MPISGRADFPRGRRKSPGDTPRGLIETTAKARLRCMEAVLTRVRLRVAPGAARNGVVGRHGDAWKVRVTAPAESGRANEAVVRLLSDTCALPRTSVTLVSGHSARDKIVELAGVEPDDIERRLSSA